MGALHGPAGLGVVGQRQDHDETFLRRDEDVPVAEAVEHYALQGAGRGLDRGEPLSGSSQGDLVCAGQVQSEWFGTLYQFARGEHPRATDPRSALDELSLPDGSSRDPLQRVPQRTRRRHRQRHAARPRPLPGPPSGRDRGRPAEARPRSAGLPTGTDRLLVRLRCPIRLRVSPTGAPPVSHCGKDGAQGSLRRRAWTGSHPGIPPERHQHHGPRPSQLQRANRRRRPRHAPPSEVFDRALSLQCLPWPCPLANRLGHLVDAHCRDPATMRSEPRIVRASLGRRELPMDGCRRGLSCPSAWGRRRSRTAEHADGARPVGFARWCCRHVLLPISKGEALVGGWSMVPGPMRCDGLNWPSNEATLKLGSSTVRAGRELFNGRPLHDADARYPS